ncbi:MAG: amidohydrolase family protein, partial [Nitrospiraceae bacterium]
ASCLLSPGAGPDQMVVELRTCAEGQYPDEWLVAGVFSADQFPDGKPNKAFLDEAFPNTPVYLHEWSLHHALVNSKALEVAGVDATTPSPLGGNLPKDEAGELTGELVEMATWLVTQHIPLSPQEVNERVVGWASEQCSKYGITSAQEAAANELALEALRAVDERGDLNLRVAAHLILKSPKFGNVPNDALEQLFADRENRHGGESCLDAFFS